MLGNLIKSRQIQPCPRSISKFIKNTGVTFWIQGSGTHFINCSCLQKRQVEKVKNKYQSPKYFVQLNQIWSPFSILYNFKLIGLSVWRILIAQCTSSMINGHTSALPSTHRSLTWINFWHFLRELSKTTTPWAENHFATKPLAERGGTTPSPLAEYHRKFS